MFRDVARHIDLADCGRPRKPDRAGRPRSDSGVRPIGAAQWIFIDRPVEMNSSHEAPGEHPHVSIRSSDERRNVRKLRERICAHDLAGGQEDIDAIVVAEGSPGATRRSVYLQQRSLRALLTDVVKYDNIDFVRKIGAPR